MQIAPQQDGSVIATLSMEDGDFAGGRDERENIAANSSPNAWGVYNATNGDLKLMPKFINSGTLPAGKLIKRAFSFVAKDGMNTVAITDNVNIWVSKNLIIWDLIPEVSPADPNNPNPWTGDNNYEIRFASLYGNLAWVNGNIYPTYWDGADTKEIATYKDTGTGATDLKCRYIYVWNNIFWFLNSDTYRDRLSFSNADNPFEVDSSNFFPVSSDRSGTGVGLNKTKNGLVIFKEDNVSLLTGYSITNYNLTEIDKDGCANNDSICGDGNTLVYLASNNAFKMTDGIRCATIQNKLAKTILDIAQVYTLKTFQKNIIQTEWITQAAGTWNQDPQSSSFFNGGDIHSSINGEAPNFIAGSQNMYNPQDDNIIVDSDSIFQKNKIFNAAHAAATLHLFNPACSSSDGYELTKGTFTQTTGFNANGAYMQFTYDGNNHNTDNMNDFSWKWMKKIVCKLVDKYGNTLYEKTINAGNSYASVGTKISSGKKTKVLIETSIGDINAAGINEYVTIAHDNINNMYKLAQWQVDVYGSYGVWTKTSSFTYGDIWNNYDRYTISPSNEDVLLGTLKSDLFILGGTSDLHCNINYVLTSNGTNGTTAAGGAGRNIDIRTYQLRFSYFTGRAYFCYSQDHKAVYSSKTIPITPAKWGSYNIISNLDDIDITSNDVLSAGGDYNLLLQMAFSDDNGISFDTTGGSVWKTIYNGTKTTPNIMAANIQNYDPFYDPVTDNTDTNAIRFRIIVAPVTPAGTESIRYMPLMISSLSFKWYEKTIDAPTSLTNISTIMWDNKYLMAFTKIGDIQNHYIICLDNWLTEAPRFHLWYKPYTNSFFNFGEETHIIKCNDPGSAVVVSEINQITESASAARAFSEGPFFWETDELSIQDGTMKQFLKIILNVLLPAGERQGIENLLVELWIDGMYACSLDSNADNAYEHPIGLIYDGSSSYSSPVAGAEMVLQVAASPDLIPRGVLGYGNRAKLKFRWYKTNLYASVDNPKLKSVNIHYLPIDAPILKAHNIREGNF